MNVTPRLTDHARDRCAQMGISTKVAKRIWRHWSVRRGIDDQDGHVIVTSTIEPSYAVIVDDTEMVPVIITVLFNEKNAYIREGAGYRLSTAKGT